MPAKDFKLIAFFRAANFYLPFYSENLSPSFITMIINPGLISPYSSADFV